MSKGFAASEYAKTMANDYIAWRRSGIPKIKTETGCFREWLTQRAIPVLGLDTYDQCREIVDTLKNRRVNITMLNKTAFATALAQKGDQRSL